MANNREIEVMTLELMVMDYKLVGERGSETIEIMRIPDHRGYNSFYVATLEAAERESGLISTPVRKINDQYLLHTEHTDSIAGLERYMRENCAWYHHKRGEVLVVSGAFKVGHHDHKTRLKGKDRSGFSLIIQGTYASTYDGNGVHDVHIQNQRFIVVSVGDRDIVLEQYKAAEQGRDTGRHNGRYLL